MKQEILHKPDFSMLKLELENGEKISTESGSMVAMQNLNLSTNTKGGAWKGLKRSVLGGESFFMNTYSASNGTGSLYLAPATPGDILHTKIGDQPFNLQSGSYLASSSTVDVSSKWGGAKSFFGGEGLFMLQCTGQGDLWFSSFGAIHEVNVEGSYIVDTGAIVGFEHTLNYNIKSVGGLKSLFFSGEGLVCEFSGVGKLYLQTRMPSSFVSWINPFRPQKSSNN